jgi:hypothetical protein
MISGHESKKSLEIYQHLSLGAVEQAYQEPADPFGCVFRMIPTLPRSKSGWAR